MSAAAHDTSNSASPRDVTRDPRECKRQRLNKELFPSAAQSRATPSQSVDEQESSLASRQAAIEAKYREDMALIKAEKEKLTIEKFKGACPEFYEKILQARNGIIKDSCEYESLRQEAEDYINSVKSKVEQCNCSLSQKLHEIQRGFTEIEQLSAKVTTVAAGAGICENESKSMKKLLPSTASLLDTLNGYQRDGQMKHVADIVANASATSSATSNLAVPVLCTRKFAPQESTPSMTVAKPESPKSQLVISSEASCENYLYGTNSTDIKSFPWSKEHLHRYDNRAAKTGTRIRRETAVSQEMNRLFVKGSDFLRHVEHTYLVKNSKDTDKPRREPFAMVDDSCPPMKHSLLEILLELETSSDSDHHATRTAQLQHWHSILCGLCRRIPDSENEGEIVQPVYDFVERYRSRGENDRPRGNGCKYMYKVGLFYKPEVLTVRYPELKRLEGLTNLKTCASHEITSEHLMADEFWTSTEAALSLLFNLHEIRKLATDEFLCPEFSDYLKHVKGAKLL